MAAEIGGDFDGTPLKELCSKKIFHHRAVIDCGRIQGGVGNVRNVVQSCLRYTIEAGADFIIPEIHSRASTDLTVLDSGETETFDYMFDERVLRKTLKETCPEMKIYKRIDDVRTDHELAFLPKLVKDQAERVLSHEEVERWSDLFEKWLSNQESMDADKLFSGPIPVNIDSPLFNWPVDFDGADFARNFGKVVQFREDVRRLAATVLFELSQNFNLGLEATNMASGFFGAHLRTAEDATKAKWTGYSLQAAEYLKQASKKHLSTIYIATGSDDDMDRFAQQAWSEHQYNSTWKDQLLKGPDLALLSELSWDQQALVDYLVMLKSASFAGIQESSFAWNIALRRHVLSSDVDFLTQSQTLEDEYSVLLGKPGHSEFIPRSMWP